jgi:hypothetical protein
LEAATDRVRVTANGKASACIKDVLEGSTADANLQDATVKPSFKV